MRIYGTYLQHTTLHNGVNSFLENIAFMQMGSFILTQKSERAKQSEVDLLDIYIFFMHDI